MYGRNHIMGAAAQTGQDYGAALGMSMACENQTKRVAELPGAIDGMERASNFLHDRVNELSSRLEGVLRPAAPEPANPAQIGVAPPSSGYASTIHGQAARIDMLAERIADLLHRLEV